MWLKNWMFSLKSQGKTHMHTVRKSNVTGTERAYKTIGKSEAIPVDKQQHTIIDTINTQQLHSSHREDSG